MEADKVHSPWAREQAQEIKEAGCGEPWASAWTFHKQEAASPFITALRQGPGLSLAQLHTPGRGSVTSSSRHGDCRGTAEPWSLHAAVHGAQEQGTHLLEGKGSCLATPHLLDRHALPMDGLDSDGQEVPQGVRAQQQRVIQLNEATQRRP